MPYTGTFFVFKDLPEISKGSNWYKHGLWLRTELGSLLTGEPRHVIIPIPCGYGYTTQII
jgi:hypothetical protein